jgi:cytochrome c biogenesis protein CcmG, thiol:disulfide interchange protein DsbE
MSINRSQICLIVAALAALVFSVAVQAQDSTARKPTFKLQALDGRVTDLANEKGNVVLVSFGATWCAPCSSELRILNEVLGEYKDKPVKFFWVSVESPEQITNTALKRYAKQRALSFPVLRDSSQAVFSQFSQRVRLPMIVVLNKDGDVDGAVQFGMRSPADAYKTDIRARLDKLLVTSSPVGRGTQGEGAPRSAP